MDTPGKRTAYCQFSVVRSDGNQEQAKTIRFSNLVPERFTVTHGRPTAIRWQGKQVQVPAFITRKRRGAESSGNAEHEAVQQNVRDGRRMGDRNGQLGYDSSSTLVWWHNLTHLLDAEIPYDLRLMFRSLATKPMLAPSKFSCVS